VISQIGNKCKDKESLSFKPLLSLGMFGKILPQIMNDERS
jgi:hypothetical protein